MLAILSLLAALALVGLVAAAPFRHRAAAASPPPTVAVLPPGLADHAVAVRPLLRALSHHGLHMVRSDELDAPRFAALRNGIAGAYELRGDDRLLLVVNAVSAAALPDRLRATMPRGRDASQASGRLYVELDSTLPADTQARFRAAVADALS